MIHMPDEQARRASALDDYVYLCGFPPMDGYLSFVRNSKDDAAPPDARVLTEAWRQGNDHVRHLFLTEAGLARSNTVGAVPAHLSELRDQVLADPVVQQTFDRTPIDVGMVEVDRLMVFQKHLNLSYVAHLKSILEKVGTHSADTFRFCLLEPPQPPVKFAKVASNGYVFVSPSNDLRFLGPALLDPKMVTGYPLPGRASSVVGLVAGFGANCLAVMEYEGHLILTNGTHRAAALRRAGLTHLPALIQKVSRFEELEFLFGTSSFDKLETYLKMERPPLFKDYFDPMLAQPVQAPQRLTQIKVTFGWENLEVPIV